MEPKRKNGAWLGLIFQRDLAVIPKNRDVHTASGAVFSEHFHVVPAYGPHDYFLLLQNINVALECNLELPEYSPVSCYLLGRSSLRFGLGRFHFGNPSTGFGRYVLLGGTCSFCGPFACALQILNSSALYRSNATCSCCAAVRGGSGGSLRGDRQPVSITTGRILARYLSNSTLDERNSSE